MGNGLLFNGPIHLAKRYTIAARLLSPIITLYYLPPGVIMQLVFEENQYYE